MIALVGLQLSNDEKNVVIRRIVTMSSLCILIFLAFVVGLRMGIPQFNQIREKIYKFNDVYLAFNRGELYFVTLFPYILASLIMILTVAISVYVAKKKNNPILLLVLLAAYLTQGIMVMAPYSPLRTTLTPIVFFWISIAYLLVLALERDYSIILAFLIAFAVQNINLGIILLILYLGVKNLKLENLKISKELLSILLLGSMVVAINWYQVYAGYRDNKKIYNQNIQRIEKFIADNPTQEEQKNKELYLLLPKDERYGFTAMTGIDWIDEAIKAYFKINNSVKLVEEININK